MSTIKLDNIIICLKCKHGLVKLEKTLEYVCENCESVYPIKDSIPTFIEEKREQQTN